MLKKILKQNLLENAYSSSLISYRQAKEYEASGYQEFSEVGYCKNVIVYRCIHLIARSVASVEWVLQSEDSGNIGDNIIYEHPILSILKRPNPTQSRQAFMENAISHLLISGNCYIMLVRNSENIPKELHVLRADRVKIVPGKNSIPKAYEYTVSNKKRVFLVDEETGESDILHLKFFNPLDDWYGMSPIEVAMNSINQHNAIAKQNISFLENGGRPSGALMYHSSMDHQKRRELRQDLKNLYEGGRNAGKILLLEGDFEWKEMGLSPKDLDFISGKEMSSREIALAFGVPSILVGSMSSATFANYKEARYNFWEETVIPILNMFANEISNWMSSIFDSKYNLSYDIDSIQALSSRREVEWNKITAADFLSDNEKREAFGYAARTEEAPPKKDP